MDTFFHACKHLACTHSHIIDGLGRNVFTGKIGIHSKQIAHQIYNVAACEVRSGFFVITLGKALHEIFSWADKNEKSVLIHCGPQKCDIPTRFERFFAEYKRARVILAHSNPVRETAEMLNKYKNVFSDTACIASEDLKLLREKATDSSKILFGSDFPVSHYFATHIFGKTHSLEEEYEENCGLF